MLLNSGLSGDGAVAEWFKATVLKTVVPKGTGGSNPSCSVTRMVVTAADKQCLSVLKINEENFDEYCIAKLEGDLGETEIIHQMEFQILIKDRMTHGEIILDGHFVDLLHLLTLFGGSIQKTQIPKEL